MLARFVWDKLRFLARLPGALPFFYWAANVLYRDGQATAIRRGPIAGYRWRHYRCYQPWMTIGLYEPDVAVQIMSILKPGDVFYDVGANAGYFTLIGAKAVGPSGTVIAFDPVPKNAATVEEQISLNGLEKVCRLEKLAVSDAPGTATFVVPHRNANAHFENVNAPHITQQDGERVTVQCVTLDAYTAEHPWPALIKMDIEGAEVKALEGAREMLCSPKAPVILVTAHSSALDVEVRRLLMEAGYTFTDFPAMIHAVPPAPGA